MRKNKLDRIFESDYIRLPRPLIRMFHLNTAVMLSEIYSEYTYWKSRNELQQGGWFFSTVENIYYNTGLSKHEQRNACKELIDFGIINVKYYGMPKRRYFKFNAKQFKELYEAVESVSNNISEECEFDDFAEICTSEYKDEFTGYSF